jgi:hypothetical protein
MQVQLELSRSKRKPLKTRSFILSRRLLPMQAWSEKRAECPSSQLHPYWNYRDELTIFDGMTLKGTRIPILQCLQPEVLNRLHYAHKGVEIYANSVQLGEHKC